MYGLLKNGCSIKFDYSLIIFSLDRNIHIPIKNDNNKSYIKRITVPVRIEKYLLYILINIKNYLIILILKNICIQKLAKS